jgi:hypothetical protein
MSGRVEGDLCTVSDGGTAIVRWLKMNIYAHWCITIEENGLRLLLAKNTTVH